MTRILHRLLVLVSLLLCFIAPGTAVTGDGGGPYPVDEVTITVYYGPAAKATQERTIPFMAGDTAMAATLRAVRTTTNPERTFIESIEGVANHPTRKEYWLYFVNGEAMHAGAAEMQLKAGDRVLWFLRRESSTKHEK